MIQTSKILNLSGDAAAIQLFVDTNDVSLDLKYLSLGYVGLGNNVQVTYTALALAADGTVGPYKGRTVCVYRRADLAVLLPGAPEFPIATNYPFSFTFAQLRTYMLANFGVVVEGRDFCLATAPTFALTDATVFNSSSLNGAGDIVLQVHDNSPRFIPKTSGGGSLLIKPIAAGGGQLDFLGATLTLNPITSLG